MDSIIDRKLYFVYDTKRDCYLEVYTDENTCQRHVDRMNDYSKQEDIYPRFAVSYSSIGKLLLDLKNGKL